MGKYSIGDKVYFIKSFDEIYNAGKTLKPPRELRHPQEKRITQVVNSKSGVLYQVRGGHFHESWIGTIVFDTMEAAKEALEKEKRS